MVIHAPRGQSEPVTFLKEDQHQIIKLCSAMSEKRKIPMNIDWARVLPKQWRFNLTLHGAIGFDTTNKSLLQKHIRR